MKKDMGELELFLSRPFSILGCSLWNYWYQSSAFESLAGFSFRNGLFLGTPAQGGTGNHEFLVRCFRAKNELLRMRNSFLDILDESPELALELLETAEAVFESGTQQIREFGELVEKGESVLPEFENLEQLFDTYASIGIYTGLIPYLYVGRCTAEDQRLRDQIQERCVSLRGKTLYPTYFEHTVLPYLIEYTGLQKENISYLTYREIVDCRKGDFEKLKVLAGERKSLSQDSNFVYTISKDTETLKFVSNEEFKQLEREAQGERESASTATDTGTREVILKGVVVSRGDSKPVTGIARVVTGTDISGVVFNEGDILVTIHSSPIYLPLIKKAGALLSEEGGVACHTAVISSENNQIVIMGISNLLYLIKNSQKIEIKQENNMIKLINHV